MFNLQGFGNAVLLAKEEKLRKAIKLIAVMMKSKNQHFSTQVTMIIAF